MPSRRRTRAACLAAAGAFIVSASSAIAAVLAGGRGAVRAPVADAGFLSPVPVIPSANRSDRETAPTLHRDGAIRREPGSEALMVVREQM